MEEYFEALIITDKRNTRTYDFMIDNLRDKLTSWKANSISLARRLTLIISVMTAIPTHLMQCTLPPKICKEIDKFNRNFLWGDSIQKKKIHLKNWDSVVKPKLLGGLGIKKKKSS